MLPNLLIIQIIASEEDYPLRITCPDDIGKVITPENLARAKRTFHNTRCVILGSIGWFVILMVAVCFHNYDSLVYPAFGFLGLAILFSLYREWFEFKQGVGEGGLLEMPQSLCMNILDIIDDYEDLAFLKERIANMDRKLTVSEANCITSYPLKILEKEQEMACRALYGIEQNTITEDK